MSNIDELKLAKLEKQKYKICMMMENGKLTMDEAQELYEPISEQYNELYRKIERERAEAYEKLIAGVMDCIK